MEAFVASLPYIFGGSSLIGVVLFLIFFKQNKALKNNEVKKSDVEVESGNIQNDMAQIDLGTHYLKSIIDASALINEANKNIIDYTNNRKDDFEKLSTDITEIKDDIKAIKIEQENIVTFLDGPYNIWKQNIDKNDK